MACSKLISGLVSDCAGNMGGVKDVWIAPAGVVSVEGQNKQVSVTVDGDQITAIENAELFKHFAFKKNAASLTKTATIDNTNNIHYIVSEVLINFAKMDTTKRIEMNALLLSDVYVIVKDSNSTYWYLGFDEPVNATGAAGQTGQAKSDPNQYSITLTDESHEFPYEVKKEVGDALTY